MGGRVTGRESPAHGGQCCFWRMFLGYTRNQAKESWEASEEMVSPPWSLRFFLPLVFTWLPSLLDCITRKRNKPFPPVLVLVPCFITAAGSELGHKSNPAENKRGHTNTPHLPRIFHKCEYLVTFHTHFIYLFNGYCFKYIFL